MIIHYYNDMPEVETKIYITDLGMTFYMYIHLIIWNGKFDLFK